jgi:hypothetical protein
MNLIYRLILKNITKSYILSISEVYKNDYLCEYTILDIAYLNEVLHECN